jgi:hypothetical protein
MGTDAGARLLGRGEALADDGERRVVLRRGRPPGEQEEG